MYFEVKVQHATWKIIEYIPIENQFVPDVIFWDKFLQEFNSNTVGICANNRKKYLFIHSKLSKDHSSIPIDH